MTRICMLVAATWLIAAPPPLSPVAAGESDGADPGPHIAALERELFEPRLSPKELDALLLELEDDQRRPAAAGRLAAEGQGHVDRIIAFAARCSNLEARHACADAVESLDAAYRTTDAGRRLGAIYREHTDALLPDYWARFRKDPSDPRAVAMLMHADPEKVYAWLGAGKDRHDPVRYLALRIRELTATDPPAPDQVAPEEAAARRKKAEAKLRIAQDFRKKAQDRDADEQAALQWVAHAEAAWRMDPTFEEAAYERCEALSSLLFRHRETQRTAENLARHFTAALQYIERFGVENKSHAVMVHDRVRVTVALAGGLSNYTPRLAPVHVEHVDTLKRLLVHALDHNLHGLSPDYQQYMLSIIYRAMAERSVPVDQREQWVDDMLARADRQSERLRAGADPSARAHHLVNYMWLRFRAIELALSDGRRERARKLWDHMRDLYQYQPPPEGSQVRWMRSVLTEADEGEWLAEFDRWHKELAARVISMIPVGFPQFDLNDAVELPIVPITRNDRHKNDAILLQRRNLQVPSLNFRAVTLPDGLASNRLRPLVVGDGVLYVLLDVGRERGLVGAIPLDETERPAGRPTWVHIDRIRYDAWDGARLLPRAPFRRYADIQDSHYADGKLFLATRESGLLVFDTGTKQWTAYGTEQGLPSEGLQSVVPLDDRTVLCVSGRDNATHFTLDLADGKVRILRADDWEKHIYCAPLLGVWRDGEKLMGWDNGWLWTDLLALGARSRPCRDGLLAYGWRGRWNDTIEIRAVLQAAGRRFLAGPSGLHEFDPAGRVVQSWWRGHSIRPAGVPASITVPPTAPGYGYKHVSAGPLIYSFCQGAIAYRPETDTWYGPLAISADSAVRGTRDGIWGASAYGLGYVRNSDFMAKAREAGRVMTTAEYLQRRDTWMEALPALDRAKIDFAMRRFDEARMLLEEIIRVEPEHAEALLLLGWLHDAWCTDQPDEARRYYARLAAMGDRADACFSGLYMKFTMLAREKRWQELIEAGDHISARFPQICDYRQQSIDWWREHAREQMAGDNGP